MGFPFFDFDLKKFLSKYREKFICIVMQMGVKKNIQTTDKIIIKK